MPRTQIIERARHRYEDIHRLLEKRWTISAIAPPSEPRSQDRAPLPRHRPRRAPGLRPRPPPQRRPEAVQGIPQRPLHETQGQVSSTRLFLEIQARGYSGSRQVVPQTPRRPPRGHRRTGPGRHPEPSRITSWIMRPRETLTESQDERLLQVRLTCPDITRACDLARAFADPLRRRRAYLLLEWIRQAEQDAPKPMKGFARFLRQDHDAVTAGLTLPWSSGVVEGHVNRVKTLKQAMGTAGPRSSSSEPESSPSREHQGTWRSSRTRSPRARGRAGGSATARRCGPRRGSRS
ncbi:transposase [Streptomyces sp. NPDC057798]|uniref:transposase n=1 Tax=Streptomyces sp. NPDC057798 TaxID=3346252 RepID=UPI00368FC17A